VTGSLEWPSDLNSKAFINGNHAIQFVELRISADHGIMPNSPQPNCRNNSHANEGFFAIIASSTYAGQDGRR
jgi:hypothetical protein